MAEVVVGVDAGATRTRVVVLDLEGREVARGDGPGAAVSPGAEVDAARGVEASVRETLATGGPGDSVSALWAGLAGAGREPVRREVERLLRVSGWARRVRVGTDAEAAFHAAFPSGPGILVLAGTGSVAVGRSRGGKTGRSGGWGALLGDEGSGYAVGLDALRAVVRSHDGRAAPTALTETVLEAVGVADVEDLVAWSAAAPRSRVAALAPAVVSAGETGDPTAREIVDRAARELGLLVRSLLERLGPWDEAPPVAAAGGLVDPGGGLRDPLGEAVASLGLTLLAARVDPVQGAARLALRLALASGD